MRRIPVNLASRPMEQQRVVAAVVGAAVLATAVVTVVHLGVGAWAATRAEGPSPSRSEVEARIPELQAELVDRAERVEWIEAVSAPRAAAGMRDLVRRLNTLLRMRTVPWPTLFASLEEALPERARLEVVQPAIDEEGSLRVSIVAAAPSSAVLQRFLARLEGQEISSRVIPRRQEIGSDGRHRLTVEVRYRLGDAATRTEAR